MNRKFLILFIFFSLAIHTLVIAVALRVDLPAKTNADKVINIEIKSSKDIENPHREKGSRPLLPKINDCREAGFSREASVDLGKPGGAYEAYLHQIRSKIERFWSYPPQALAERREGNAVIRFSINAKGVLADSVVISSSGNVLLDEGALASIRTAAPFEPLPADYNLSFLHITATFSYQINL
jgi:protein TonB